MSLAWEDDRIRRGMARQFETRRDHLAAGARSIGWKAGFGSAAALERFGIDGPLVGFLTDATLLPSGAVVAIGDWTETRAEPEVAVYIGSDIPEGADLDRVRASIAGVGPAIELADIHPATEDVEEILAGDIFHRQIILGGAEQAPAGGVVDGLRATIILDGTEVGSTSELEELTGAVLDVVAHVAMVVSAAGEQVRAGDVIICGSVVPALAVSPGHDMRFELTHFEPVSVTFVD